jgi:hypothetical protein
LFWFDAELKNFDETLTATNFLFTNSHALKYSKLSFKTFCQIWRTVRKFLLLLLCRKNNIIVIVYISETVVFRGIAPELRQSCAIFLRKKDLIINKIKLLINTI